MPPLPISIPLTPARERSRLLAIASAGDANKSPGKRTAAGGIDQVSSPSIAQEENVGLSFPRAGRKHRQRHWAHMSTLAGNHAAGDSSICNVGDVHEECRFGHEDSEQHAPIDTETMLAPLLKSQVKDKDVRK
ncbi:hypothetical protein EJB05_00281, partial [Eragrostis curvula]